MFHQELEIWIEWLGLRTYELIYSCDTKEVFDSEEYCIIRSHSENLWSASDGFICETQRLFCEFKGYMYKYNMYPRHMVSCTRDGLKTVQMSLGRHLIDIYPFPAGETIYCDMTFYLINFFDNDTRIESAIKKRWCKWLDSNIKQYYHDKTKITLQKTALGHVLRPGEIMRATHQKMGIIPSLYEVLKKNRPSGALDHIDFHLFASSWNDLRSYFEALDGIYDCRKDAILLCLIDQYLQHTYNLDFRKFFCREEINWTYNFKDIETSSHPLLIQIMGGWDVYYKGDLYHTRQFSRAFLVWCYKMHGFYSVSKIIKTRIYYFSLSESFNAFVFKYSKTISTAWNRRYVRKGE